MKNSRLDFPAQTGPYAVKIKNGAQWRTHTVARLQISIGQPYHEGDKLAATLNWVRHRFDHVILCANDTLQRFNYQFEESLSTYDAFRKSEDLGTQWVERNSDLIRTLPSVELHRWEDWKSKPDYQASQDQTNNFYNNNAEFRDAIEANIIAFWKRQKHDNDSLSGCYKFSRFAEGAREYLLEETAVFSMMFKQDSAVDIYPGSVLLPCVMFQGRKVEGAPEGLDLGTFTRIDFSRNKSFSHRTAKVA